MHLKGSFSCFVSIEKHKTPFVPRLLTESYTSTFFSMANVLRGYKPVKEQVNFRYLRSTDPKTLERWGYYHGFPCAFGHTIRDSTNHWCYECVLKIKSNFCGFDLNYLHLDYKVSMHRLWQRVQIGDWDDCWDITDPGTNKLKRVWMPSHRSFKDNTLGNNITVQKAIYACAWGDVGSLRVSRTCNNSRCCNPLHMVSSWNRKSPPKLISPFCTEYQVEKLMLLADLERKGMDANKVIQREFKASITAPKDAQIDPKYNEE
jgi:hypothetical protein